MLPIAPYVLQRQNGSANLRNRHKKWTTDKKNSDKSEQKARFHSEKPVISSATLNLISPIDPHHGARIAGFHGRVDQWYQRSQSKPITAERQRPGRHAQCLLLDCIPTSLLKSIKWANLVDGFIKELSRSNAKAMYCNGVMHRQTRTPFFLGIRSGMDMSNSPGGTKGEKIVL